MSTKFCQLLNLCRYRLCFFFFWLLEYSTPVLYGNEHAICSFLKSNDKSISAYTSVTFHIDVPVHIHSPLQCSYFSPYLWKILVGCSQLSLCICFIMSLRLSVLNSFSSQYEKLQSHHAKNKTPFFS